MNKLLLLACAAALAVPASAEDGRFYRVYAFEPGIQNGNPMANPRFRVNAPEAVLHRSFGQRSETRSSGMMQIRVPEDLSLLDAAELYLELWGGHPGTARKRVTLNGRSTYELPDDGVAAKNCAHQYPTIPLKITDLVNGYNAVQFACDQGTSFWGHFIVDNAFIRAGLKPDHPYLREARLDACRFAVQASAEGESIRLRLDTPPGCLDAVSSVHFQGFYTGYDENGSRQSAGWHGFTKRREPVAYLGSATAAPFAAAWDVSMLPPQKNMSARAWVRFKNRPELLYISAPVSGLATPAGRPAVRLFTARQLPAPFHSRLNRKVAAEIDLDVDPARVARAELHVVLWDGGGCGPGCFTLNGQDIEAADRGRHDVLYRVIPLDPTVLRKGPNRVELAANTEEHGVEVLLPGPAIAIRER